MWQLVPGTAIGPYRLGDPVPSGEAWSAEERHGLTVYRRAGVWLYVTEARVTQVGVVAPARGVGPGGLHLGGRAGDIAGELVFDTESAVFGLVAHPGLTVSFAGTDEDELRDASMRHARVSLSPDARVDWLGVHVDADEAPRVPVDVREALGDPHRL